MNAVTKKQNAAAPAAATENERVYVAPDVDITETEHGYTLEADMPGVSKANMELTLDHNTLTIVGHRAEHVPHVTMLHRESKPASFRRVFELDPAIDQAKIRAQMNQGVLILDLPKTERVKPRQIAVE